MKVVRSMSGWLPLLYAYFLGRAHSQLSQPPEEESEVKQLLRSLDAKIHSLDAKIDSSNARMDKNFGQLHHALGINREVAYRPTIFNMEAMSQTSPLLLQSLPDLAIWLAQQYGVFSDYTELLNMLCTAIIEEDVASHMLRRIQAEIQGMAPAARDTCRDKKEMEELYQAMLSYKFAPDDDEGGNINTTELEKFITCVAKINSGKHQPLLRTLRGIKDLLLRTDEQKMEYLTKAGGVGICLAVFAAQRQEPAVFFKASPVKNYNDITRGFHELEINVQGKVTVVNKTAHVWVGEFKSSGSLFSQGVKQLKVRLALLKWAVCVTRPKVSTVMALGKLYIPAMECANLQVHDVEYEGGDIQLVRV
eukprot:CAMPEP_0202894214 /NCGR_PEP_ID=MMETSP1392-20130828/3660_1 /ASSEMBLY_ACC=CAM_ASM_000868 /TAXON_ID=225041 /ORGANISM="Chlamydomonas chlamydogama, Strain SAG 11-48b" /LENGTH=362 /DNA_ID=CAMNT_0049578835 /DNA_START=355 /DNA_END=1443 /DNA_ORIENTATION=+